MPRSFEITVSYTRQYLQRLQRPKTSKSAECSLVPRLFTAKTPAPGPLITGSSTKEPSRTSRDLAGPGRTAAFASSALGPAGREPGSALVSLLKSKTYIDIVGRPEGAIHGVGFCQCLCQGPPEAEEAQAERHASSGYVFTKANYVHQNLPRVVRIHNV